MKKMNLQLTMGGLMVLTAGLTYSFATTPIKKGKTKKYEVIRVEKGKTIISDTVVTNSVDYTPEDYLKTLGYPNNDEVQIIDLSQAIYNSDAKLVENKREHSITKVFVNAEETEKQDLAIDLQEILAELKANQKGEHKNAIKVIKFDGQEEVGLEGILDMVEDYGDVTVKEIVIKDSLSDSTTLISELLKDMDDKVSQDGVVKVIRLDDQEDINVEGVLEIIGDSDEAMVKKIIIEDSLSDPTTLISELLKDMDVDASTLATAVKVIKINGGKATTTETNIEDDFTIVIVSDVTDYENKVSSKTIENIQNATVNIYPNPATEAAVLSLNFEEKEMTTVQVFDIHGKVVHQADLGAVKGMYRHEFNAKDWSVGIYIVTIKHGKEVFHEKFIIE